MPAISHKNNAHHYNWGDGCDGWTLTPHDDLLIIEERMPPGAREQRHFHGRARQFFYCLSGVLTMEINGETFAIAPRAGIEVLPGQTHQARNEGAEDVFFLVISAPTTRGDKHFV